MVGVQGGGVDGGGAGRRGRCGGEGGGVDGGGAGRRCRWWGCREV